MSYTYTHRDTDTVFITQHKVATDAMGVYGKSVISLYEASFTCEGKPRFLTGYGATANDAMADLYRRLRDEGEREDGH